MNMRLPITEWVPYLEDRFYCTIDFNWPPSYSQPGCLHFRIHQATSNVAGWNDPTTRGVAISEVTRGVRENCRIAFNAAMVEEAWADNTLVPRSSLIYLDSMVFYILGAKYNLKGIGNVGSEFVLKTEYHEQWLDAMVYLRHIRGIHQTVYTMDDDVVQLLGGTPKYIERVEMEKTL